MQNDKTLRYKVEELPSYAPAFTQYGKTHALRLWGHGHWELHEGATADYGDLIRCELLGQYFVATGKGPTYSRHLTNDELQAAMALELAA